MSGRIVGTIALVAFLAIAAFVPMRSASALDFPDEVPFDQAKFDAAQAEKKPILVHITATWCSICAKQKEILATLRKEDKFKPLLVFNVDFDSQKDLVRKFGAHAQSTMVVFKGKKEAGIFSGDTREKAIAILLARAL